MNKKIFILMFSFLLSSCDTPNNIGSDNATNNHNIEKIDSVNNNEDTMRVSDIEDKFDLLICGGRKSCDNNINFLSKNTEFDINKKPIINNGLDIKFIKLISVNYDTCPKFDLRT